jgi:hypothetical protein
MAPFGLDEDGNVAKKTTKCEWSTLCLVRLSVFVSLFLVLILRASCLKKVKWECC